MGALESAYQPGRILYIPIQFNNSTKWERKRIIYICDDTDGDPIFLKICSTRPRREFWEIKSSNYQKSLLYDSYVDCGQVFNKVCSSVDFITSLGQYSDSVLDCLFREDKEQIVRWTNSSKTISQIHKDLIKNAFS